MTVDKQNGPQKHSRRLVIDWQSGIHDAFLLFFHRIVLSEVLCNTERIPCDKVALSAF
jgi:hypothetical protein